MCILFIVIGDESHPTLILNNRDEFIGRPTIRGRIDHHLHDHNGERSLRYTPKDMESGGSWLSFDRLVDKHDHLRFAVVLNFDTFREDHLPRESAIGTTVTSSSQSPKTTPSEKHSVDTEVLGYSPTPSQRPLSSLRSRGNLVKNFIDSDITAEEYALTIFNERCEYRPFNLIISDGCHGAYYVSSSIQQSSPIRLDSGVLYGISNGYLFDDWKKVSLGKELITEILDSEVHHTVNKALLQRTQRQDVTMRENVSGSSVVAGNASSHSGSSYTECKGMKDLERELPALMLTATTTSDTHNKTNTNNVTVPSHLSHYVQQLMNVLKVDKIQPDPTYDMKNQALCQISSIYVIPTVILMDEIALPKNIPLIDHHILLDDYVNKSKEPLLEDRFYEETALGKLVFATRTHTLLLHWSKAFLTYQASSAPAIATADSLSDKDDNGSPSPHPLFFIAECDYSFHWKNNNKHITIDHDINCFHNFC